MPSTKKKLVTRTARGKKKVLLPKQQKAQVKSIVKSEIRKELETKYFDVDSINNTTDNGLGLSFFQSNSNKAVWVRGFQLINESDLSSDFLTYGVSTDGTTKQPLFDFNMADNYATGDQQRVGQYVTPSFCQTEWIINRLQLDVTEAGLYGAGQTANYRCRLLRLVPRTDRGSNQGDTRCDPSIDAFFNQTGKAVGIGSRNMSSSQVALFKVNTRRYHVKLDTQFDIACPLAIGTTSLGDGDDMRLFSGIGPQRKEYKFRHNIGNKIYYSDGSDVPEAGAKNEFILYHVWIPSAANSQDIAPNTVRLHAKAISTFKDT